MSRVVLAMDPVFGVEATQLAAAWHAEASARQLGAASVERDVPGTFLPGLAELVVIPLLVNIASSVLVDVVKAVVARARRSGHGGEENVEVEEFESGTGDRIVVVRLRPDIP